MKDPYIFTHMDFMVNLSNWIGGERDDRVYYAVPSPASVTTYRVSPTNSSATGATGRTIRSLSQPVCSTSSAYARPWTSNWNSSLDAAQQQHALNPEFGNTESGRSLQCHGRSYVPFQPPWLQTASPYTAADVMAYQAAWLTVIWLWPQYRPTMPN